MADNFGTGVSRVLDPKQAQYLGVIFQQGKPPLDSEFNLLQQMENDWRQQVVLRGVPSGFLGNETNTSKDFITSPSWSNWFRFGPQKTGEKRAIMWAAVNGWLIPVTGTGTGTPPGSPNNTDTWNKVTLDPPPSNSGDYRSDFVFLEVWQARLPPTPSSTNKPSASSVYRYGNVEGGYAYLSDETQDPAIGFETTQRVQVQYRIRVVKGLIGLSTYPDGFDPTVVKGRGAASSDTSYTFSNMRQELGDPGLWRAGDGTSNSLGTVDGYTYAIPLCVVFRRNSVVWAPDPSQNLNGGFNRNPTAVDRTGVKTFSTTPVLASAMTDTSTSLTLVSATDIPLPAAPTSPVLIQIGSELLTYGGSGTAISGVTVSNLVRGVHGTKPEAHPAGVEIKVLSGRPDGLFSDQIAATDILDLRHVVNPNGFDYDTLLAQNLDKLLRGQLRANWKRNGSGPQGPFVAYQDRVSTSSAGLGVTKVDSPDGFRTIFSDAAVQQRIEMVCEPYVSTLSAQDQAMVSNLGSSSSYNITDQSNASSWTDGDNFYIPVAQFKSTLPGSDGDQARFLNEVPAEGTSGVANGTTTFTDTAVDFTSVVPGDSLVIFAGAAMGTYGVVSSGTTTLTLDQVVPTAVGITYVVRRGLGAVEIRVGGTEAPLPPHRYMLSPSNPTSSDDLTITLNGSGTPFSTAESLYVSSHLQYGAGRGLSRRPDSLHSVMLTSPSSVLLTQQWGVTSSTQPTLRISPAYLWSKYRNGLYKNQLPVTAEAYADLGSKTLILTPYRAMQIPDQAEIKGPSINVSPTATDSGTTGSSTGTTLFTDLGASFGLYSSGYALRISQGPSVGTYQILSSTGTTLTLDRAVPTGTNITYTIHKAQGVMPLYKADGTTAKWASTDPLGHFSGQGDPSPTNKNTFVTVPRSMVPGWGAVRVPILPNNGANFHRGANFMLMSREGLTPNDADHNKAYINYSVGRSYASMSTGNFSGVSTVPATYNSTFTQGGNTYAGARLFTDTRGLGRKGIELPPFYGIARLFGVYEASDYKANGSAFSATTREPTGGGAKNLLKYDFSGPTFWIETDDDGDSTFIINADVLDLTKATSPISSFESAYYVVEASIFGFDRGSFELDKPFRLVMSRARTGATPFPGPNVVLPAAMPAGDTALVNYSRTPYQGDPWGSQTTYMDIGYAPGALTSSTAYQVSSSALNLSALTRPNQKPLEVLSSVGFVTTLGTGRLSGDPVPGNAYDFRNVGFEDPTVYPPTSGVAPRPAVLTPAVVQSNEPDSDREISPEYLGLTERLPLGALFRDKDFRGGRLSLNHQAAFVYLSSLGMGLDMSSVSKTKAMEQEEAYSDAASTSPGMAGDVLVHVDGEQGNYALLTNYRVARGGSVFVGSGEHPGGELHAVYDNVEGTGRGTTVLTGRAFLVRNSVTTVGSTEVSAGDELMMLVATTVTQQGVTPDGARVTIGTNGTGEGYSAADLYRIEGHPLVSNNVRYEVVPSSVTLADRGL